ncbi:MAG: hypothetical protein HC829_00015 [Bacteroidales bacterium]|nr:hypothetical protein [Bacteroidales bacterium]
MRDGRLLLAGSAFAGTLAALLALSPYLAAALAFAELTSPNPDSDRLLLIGLAAVAGVALRHLFFGLSTALSHLIAFRVQKELRFRLAAKLSRVPLGWFDDTAKGRVRSILLDDVEATEDGIAHLIPETSAALLAPLLVLVALVVVDWRLTILTLVPMVAGMWLLGRLLKSGEGRPATISRSRPGSPRPPPRSPTACRPCVCSIRPSRRRSAPLACSR